MSRLTKQQRAKVERALAQHDRHSGSYWWTPPAGASSRRDAEERNTWCVEFTHGGRVYRYESRVSCSCRNYYYTGVFTVDGEKKTRRAFSALLPKTANKRAEAPKASQSAGALA